MRKDPFGGEGISLSHITGDMDLGGRQQMALPPDAQCAISAQLLETVPVSPYQSLCQRLYRWVYVGHSARDWTVDSCQTRCQRLYRRVRNNHYVRDCTGEPVSETLTETVSVSPHQPLSETVLVSVNDTTSRSVRDCTVGINPINLLKIVLRWQPLNMFLLNYIQRSKYAGADVGSFAVDEQNDKF